MAQSALTVTAPNPTPPTNLSYVGSTPPLDPAQAQADDGIALQTPNSVSLAAANGATYNEPSGSRIVFAAKTAAAGAGSSVDAEGKGSEVLVTAASPNPSAYGQLQTVSNSLVLTPGTLPVPNNTHPSSLSAAVAATLTSASGASNVSGIGTTLLTATGTLFNRSSVIYVNGVAQNTSYVSPTSLTCNALKKISAGTLPVYVVTNGVATAPVNWTLT